ACAQRLDPLHLLGHGRPQAHGQVVLTVLKRLPDGGWHFGGPGGDRYAVLAQQPPYEVEAGGPLALEQLAGPMQGLQTLLAWRLDRNGIDLTAARGLEQPSSIGAVGLV